MEVGLYFGSFNPIHIGHCIIANYVRTHSSLQQVWLVVSPQNPFKPAAGLLNEYDRLHLVKLAIEGIDGLQASDIEFHLPRPSYTIDTLTYLSEKFPQHRFSIIMGSDGYQNIRKWKNAAVLLEHYPIYVYQRPGYPIQPESALTTLVNAPLLDISATQIRQLVKENNDIRFLVPEPVRKEIEANRYYK